MTINQNRFVALPYYIRYFVVTASINTDQGFRKLIVPQVINQNQSMKQTNQAKSTGRRFVLIKLQWSNDFRFAKNIIVSLASTVKFDWTMCNTCFRHNVCLPVNVPSQDHITHGVHYEILSWDTLVKWYNCTSPRI